MVRDSLLLHHIQHLPPIGTQSLPVHRIHISFAILVILAQKRSAANAVIITDINDYKLDKARECGTDFAVNPRKEDLSRAILRDFGPGRADLILECVGAQETIAQAIENARKGTTIVIVGVFGREPEVDLGLVQDHVLSLVGTLMYQRQDYE
jgi:L-iditol 2-dehydrogenase